MGPTHAASGAVGGIVAAAWLPSTAGGAESLTAALVYGGVAAGAALLPDFDHPNSTISRSGGILTGSMHRVVAAISIGFREATSTSKDSRNHSNGHRGLTHTLLFAVLVGVCVWWAAPYPLAAAIIIGLCLWWAELGLVGAWADRNPIWAILIPVGISSTAFWLPGLTNPQGLAVAIVIGLVLHDLGDALTINGDPFLAPLVPFGGKRWWNFRIPASVTIASDGLGNRVLMLVFGLAVVVLPFALSPPIASHLYTAWGWTVLERASTWPW